VCCLNFKTRLFSNWPQTHVMIQFDVRIYHSYLIILLLLVLRPFQRVSNKMNEFQLPGSAVNCMNFWCIWSHFYWRHLCEASFCVCMEWISNTQRARSFCFVCRNWFYHLRNGLFPLDVLVLQVFFFLFYFLWFNRN